MKRRLICLLLCLVMVLSLVLTACSKKTTDEAADNISDAASEQARTLTMWIVSENKLSDETVKVVSEELNAITKAKFKTQLVVYFLTEDVYRSTLSNTIKNYEDSKKVDGVIMTEATEAADGTAEVTDATETLANGLTVIKYPDLVNNQVDIVYISGEDMYLDYINKGWLYALDAELTGGSKKIKEYISATLLSAVQLNGKTYAVPNNNVIGEYTYMLLNKELMQKYSQQGYVSLGKIDGFFNTYLYNFLLQIHQFERDVVPVNASYEDCLDLLGHYWSVDPETQTMLDEFSLFGHHYTDIKSLSRGSVVLGYESLFSNPEFTEDYLKLNEFKFNGYFDETEGKAAAVKFVKGDSTILKQYEDEYYSVVVEYPTASTDDIYSNMFGVCTYTRDLSRSMQIVTYLNTNAAFRNLLQYGVENVHYKMVSDEEGTKTELVRLNNDYMMDIYATGNAFLAYPEPTMSQDIWENGKIQNRSSLVNPLLGFDIPKFAIEKGTTEESVKIPEAGYIMSYSTGYSKDVLSQNNIIKNWLAACDADAEQNTFVLKTYAINGQNLTCEYYIYKKGLTSAVDFDVTVEPHIATSTTPDGEEKQTLESIDFHLNYKAASGSSKGYELSVFSLLTKKSTDYLLKANLDGTEAAISETQHKELVKFDFYNTQEYSVDLYSDLTKTHIYKNQDLLNWLLKCDKVADDEKAPMNFVWTYTDAATGYVTYVVYRTGLKVMTSVDITPTGDKGEFNINFNFDYVNDNFYKLELSPTISPEKRDREYMLYYVRVKPNVQGLDISYTITENGDEADVTEEVAAQDPDFVMLGKLDTELIKFMKQLNDELLTLINACQTYDELVALVEEISMLLNVDSAPRIENYVILKDWIQNGMLGGDLVMLKDYLKSAAASKTTAMTNEEGDPIYWVDPVSKLDEVYVEYDSLYTLYNQWLDAYGFRPSKKENK